MKRIAVIVGAILLVLILGVGVYLMTRGTDEAPQAPGAPPFPAGGQLMPEPSSERLLIAAQGGEVEVNDFIHDGITVRDVVSPGRSVLVGDLGYCLADGSCPKATDVTRFHISYDEEGSFFTIVLLAEPLSEVRREAEQHLMNRLGIPEILACQLNYYVGTPSFVNEAYSNGNMLFSFCEGATLLP
ncbi:MAG TPA: hypothetical protein VEA36_02295 [Candidatus Paceibacterota bacterium]|nr:hypothetical protein [Candidatus Paceibacterota bacterium]